MNSTPAIDMFIITDGPKLVADDETRNLIRQRASILGAERRTARRKAERRKQQSAGENASQSHGRVKKQGRMAHPKRLFEQMYLAGTVLSTDYEFARSRFGADVTSLSIIANSMVCGFRTDMISAFPTWLTSSLDSSQWSFLQYIPSRYGSSECLTTATNCLMQRMYGKLCPGAVSVASEAGTYTKALRSLNIALTDPETSMSADVLCASELLSLYERLEPEPDHPGGYHSKGFATLVKHRKPQRFTSDFEKALFAAIAEPIVADASSRDEHFFLEDPEWMDVYMSIAQESDTLTFRSPLTIQARLHIIRVSGMWIDLNHMVMTQEFFDEAAVGRLYNKAEQLHKDILDTLDEYAKHCGKVAVETISSPESIVRRDVVGNALSCALLVKRFLATLCDNFEQRHQFEIEAQELARTLLEVQVAKAYSILFSAHEISFAQSVLATGHDWLHGDEGEHYRLAMQRRYRAWSMQLRSDMPLTGVS